MFTNPANGDYHLQTSSPCINVGYNYLPLLPATDKDGYPRIVNGVIDMGAYEYQGRIIPTTPDLLGVLKEFHYYKYGERIVVKIEILNRGLNAGPFKVSFYLSENGKTLDRLIDEEVFKKGLKSNSSMITSAEYDSSTTLSGKYVIAIVDSGNQISEMNEINDRISIRIP